MIRNILEILGVALVALVITVIVSRWRNRGKFDHWWDSEGFVWFVIIGIAVYFVGCGLGFFRFIAWS